MPDLSTTEVALFHLKELAAVVASRANGSGNQSGGSHYCSGKLTLGAC